MGAAALIALASWAGCATSHEAEPLGEPTTVAASTPTNPIDGLYPGSTSVYEVEDGGFLTRLLNADAGPAPEGVTPWLEMTSVVASPDDEPEPIRVARLGRDAGGVLLLSSVNPRRDIETVFDPPLRIAPNALDMGASHTDETALTLIASPADADQRETTGGGVARVTTTRRPPESVVTPRGTFDAERIDVRLEMDLDRSRVDRLARYAIAGDRVVMIDSSQTVTAFGFTVSRERRTARICCESD